MPDELWTEVRDIVQETGIKTIPMEKKCKNAKWLSGEALQIAVKRREVKSKREKERYKLYPVYWVGLKVHLDFSITSYGYCAFRSKEVAVIESEHVEFFSMTAKFYFLT